MTKTLAAENIALKAENARLREALEATKDLLQVGNAQMLMNHIGEPLTSHLDWGLKQMNLYHFSFDIANDIEDHFFVLADSRLNAEQLLEENGISQNRCTESLITCTGSKSQIQTEQIKKMTTQVYKSPLIIKCYGTYDPQAGGGIKIIAP